MQRQHVPNAAAKTCRVVRQHSTSAVPGQIQYKVQNHASTSSKSLINASTEAQQDHDQCLQHLCSETVSVKPQDRTNSTLVQHQSATSTLPGQTKCRSHTVQAQCPHSFSAMPVIALALVVDSMLVQSVCMSVCVCVALDRCLLLPDTKSFWRGRPRPAHLTAHRARARATRSSDMPMSRSASAAHAWSGGVQKKVAEEPPSSAHMPRSTHMVRGPLAVAWRNSASEAPSGRRSLTM